VVKRSAGAGALSVGWQRKVDAVRSFRRIAVQMGLSVGTIQITGLFILWGERAGGLTTESCESDPRGRNASQELTRLDSQRRLAGRAQHERRQRIAERCVPGD
jgi:hypothetical protein